MHPNFNAQTRKFVFCRPISSLLYPSPSCSAHWRSRPWPATFRLSMWLFLIKIRTNTDKYTTSLSLSSLCHYTLSAVTTNPDAAACLRLDILMPSLVGVKTFDASTIDAWLTSMCAAAPCNPETFSSVVGYITAGCSKDGDIPKMLLNILQSTQYIYPTARRLLCLKKWISLFFYGWTTFIVIINIGNW